METLTSYDAMSHPVDPFQGHEPRSIYRSPGQPRTGKFPVTLPYYGMIRNSTGEWVRTNQAEVAYTIWGDKGPLVAFLHGVPTNRRQWYPVQKRVASFCRTISFDMMGMGESSMVRFYGKNQDTGINAAWDWINDCGYVDQLMRGLFGNEKFVFVADDWGGGINAHYAARYPERLLAMVQVNPIAFDGYPVNEIQAIGRASAIEDDKEFAMAMGSVDQTMVQIFKTMVYDPNKYNQYKLREIMFPYVDVDYERSKYRSGEDATSMTMRLKQDALRVLADRAAILSPALLLPYHPIKNPKGVKYDKINIPVLIANGAKDNMMPANQAFRYQWVMPNSRVDIHMIPQAGHFAGTDQPEIVAGTILNFLVRELGKNALADIFLGFKGIWKGDEEQLIDNFRRLYGKADRRKGGTLMSSEETDPRRRRSVVKVGSIPGEYPKSKGISKSGLRHIRSLREGGSIVGTMPVYNPTPDLDVPVTPPTQVQSITTLQGLTLVGLEDVEVEDI